MLKLMHKSFIRHLMITLIAFMVVGLFALVTINVSFLSPIARTLEEFSITDMYYQALQSTTTPDTSHVITIVDMTELYERQQIAKSIECIEERTPKVLGVDVIFEGLKEDPQGDMMIEYMAKSCGNAIFSYRLLDYNSEQQQFTNEVHSFFTKDVNVKEGYTNIQRQLYGGIKREVSLSRPSCGEQKPSFVAVVANQYADKEMVTLEDDDLQIYFAPIHFPRLRYDSVVVHPELIADRIVLFGATGDETDMHYTPIGKMSGVELLSYAINTLLMQQRVRKPSLPIMIIVSLALVLLTQVLQDQYEKRVEKIKSELIRSFASSSVALGVITFLWMVVLMWGAFLLFSMTGWSLNLGWALSAIVFVDASRSFYDTCIKSLNA